MTATLKRSQIGTVQYEPGTVLLQTSDNLATVTAAGYMNTVQAGSEVKLTAQDIVYVTYDMPSKVMICAPVFSSGIITLDPIAGVGSNVVLPTIANHIATYTNTTGTISEDAATAINGGNIQAGLSGTAGALISYPGTAAKGNLELVAVANTGNTNVTISNVAHGQASVYSIPDAGNAVGRILNAATATPFTTGNLISASGTGGLTVDSGILATNVVSKAAANTFSAGGSLILNKVNGTESGNAVTASGTSGLLTTSSLSTVAGSSYAITWTNTDISATSTVLLSVQGGTNTTVSIQMQVVVGSGTATLTIYNTDPAASLNGTILIGYLVM